MQVRLGFERPPVEVNDMPLLSATFLLISVQGQSLSQAYEALQSAVGSGSQARVSAMFQSPRDARYLFEMAGRSGGLRRLSVKVIPAPPGWGALGDHWAIFHRFQDIQQDHDVVHPLVRTPSGYKLMGEVHEWLPQAARVRHARIEARLIPSDHRIEATARLDLAPAGLRKALVFRLNDGYAVSGGSAGNKPLTVVTAESDKIPAPKEGDLVRAGGLLILWGTDTPERVEVTYSGVVNQASQDKITPNVAYVTALWVPTIARLPHTTTVRIQGPKDWVLRSEGVPVSAAEAGFAASPDAPDEQTVHYKCDLPISFPKIVGGRYTLAAELQSDGKTYRAWHLEPQVDKARGQRDVNLMADSIRFFEQGLGPFPFPGYECFDGDTYYGIESYSYTLLQRGITTRFMSHEIGHTYFGGMAPSAYTKDTWNEGVTQYYDSVVYGKNADRSLEAGYGTLGLAIPLSEMGVAWANGSATYFRGAYVMKMLENEIGLPAVQAGLKALVTERRGLETRWPDLRQYFERAASTRLDWFWNQWITNATFPSLSVLSAQAIQEERRFVTRVVVRQQGTASPFRLRFKVRVARGAQVQEEVVTMNSPQAVFTMQTPWEPREASVEVFGLALTQAGPAVAVTR